MNIHLSPSKLKSSSHITITGSKSETNRLLLLQALFSELELKNTSNSDDSDVMLKALRGLNSNVQQLPSFGGVAGGKKIKYEESCISI